MGSFSVAALVTARGNNRFSRKHLQVVLGKKLIEYPLLAAKRCQLFDAHFLSSDDGEILSIGRRHGYQTIVRPEELSRPDSQHVDAIRHALAVMRQQYQCEPDAIAVILGNTVYIKDEWLQQSICLMREHPEATSVAPVHQEQNHHPYRAKLIGDDGFLKTYFDFAGTHVSTNRQDLPGNYFLCHNFWLLRNGEWIHNDAGQPPWTFLGSNILPLVLSDSFDVHEQDDLLRCEAWLRENGG